MSGEQSRGLVEEQAALRRVATLVARGGSPEDVFAAVTKEVGGLLPVSSAAMGRYDSDGMFTTVAAWSIGVAAFPVGRRWFPEGRNVTTLVFCLVPALSVRPSPSSGSDRRISPEFWPVLFRNV